jgi:two-component system OmpR family response regulator
MDGYELLERLRALGDETPALMLTARGERGDVTRGLRLGADDYVTKPFGLEELMLRIAAILRRTIGSGDDAAADIICGPVVLNEDRHSVTLHGKPIDLSPTEFKLLYELMIKQGKVVTKATLLDVVWGMAFAANATVVDTYISYLRKKLHTDNFEGIKTVRGIGFQIVAE